jgi:hypothetical protein
MDPDRAGNEHVPVSGDQVDLAAVVPPVPAVTERVDYPGVAPTLGVIWRAIRGGAVAAPPVRGMAVLRMVLRTP